MAWPCSQDYNEALQNPLSSFRDPELRQGRVLAGPHGIPQPCSGSFADVYAVECPIRRTKWAVKCFTREAHGLRERYREISKHLQQARLAFTIDFQFLDEGVRIADRWYPVVKMQWVEGFLLNSFVRAHLDQPAILEVLARAWLRLSERLREASLAHGDLQHGNILLVPDSNMQSVAIKLIDYDGMWVPSLANQSAPGELGHPGFQHPQRLREGTYGSEMDRFPLLAIYCALRALAATGQQLWDRFDTGDNLLFRQQDFEAPARSPLFAELLRLPQAEVRELAVSLIDAARRPLDQTPWLGDVLSKNIAAPPRTAVHAKVQTTPPIQKTKSSPPSQGLAANVSSSSTAAPLETDQVLSRISRTCSSTDWAALRVWAAAIRDDEHRTSATRQEAALLISILDAHHNMRQRHQHLAGELWESALKLAEKLGRSDGTRSIDKELSANPRV